MVGELLHWPQEGGVELNQVLYGLLKADAFDAVLLLGRAADFLDGKGRLRGSMFDQDFLSSVYSHMDAPAQQAFFCDHADKDVLLAAVAALNEYANESRQLLACGADPNAKLPCNATALSGWAWGEAGMDNLKALLAGGANPNATGGSYCYRAGDRREAATPLWILATRWKKEGAWHKEEINLLLDSGADPTVKGPRGESLASLFADDQGQVELWARLQIPPRRSATSGKGAR